MFENLIHDLKALKQRNIRLIYVVGCPGSGKSLVCSMLEKELNINHVSISDLLNTEIKNKTKIGQACLEYVNKGQLAPNEIIFKLLIKRLVNTSGKVFIIDGFPKTLEQALFIENNLSEIKLIVNFICSDEILKDRLSNRESNQILYDRQDIENIISNYKEESKNIMNFYRKYGVVKDIRGDEHMVFVYQKLKELLIPDVYCILGKRYSGKTTIAKAIVEKNSNIKHIDFNSFINGSNSNNIVKKRSNDDQFVIQCFIDYLREQDCSKIIIENFPTNQSYYKLFTSNGKKIEKIYSLNTDDNTISERMASLGIDNDQYIGSAQLKIDLDKFCLDNPVTRFLSKYPNFKDLVEDFNLNNYLHLDINHVINSIKPKIFIIDGDECIIKDELENKLIKDFGFDIIDTEKIIQETIKRENNLGKELKEYSTSYNDYPYRLVLECLKKVVFRLDNTKLILKYNNFTYKLAKMFEEYICNIDKLIYVVDQNNEETNRKYNKEGLLNYNIINTFNKEELSAIIYFKEKNKLFIYDNKEINNYVVDDLLNINKSISICFGLPFSGKTLINNHLCKSYGYELLDLNEIIKKTKEIKSPDDPDSAELVVKDLLNEVYNIINSPLNLNKKYCIDNIINSLIVDIDSVKSLLDTLGTFRYFYYLICNDNELKTRYKKIKLESNSLEELNDGELEEYNNSILLPNQIIEELISRSFKTIKLSTTNKEDKTLKEFDKNYGCKIINIKHNCFIEKVYNKKDYHDNLELVNTIENYLLQLSLINNALYINVPELIYSHFYENKDTAVELKRMYSKKYCLKNVEKLNYKNDNNQILTNFFKYNPIHFDDSLILKIIKDKINSCYKQIEKTGNVIIFGLFNSDLLSESDKAAVIPLKEIKNINEIGYFKSYIQISNSSIDRDLCLMDERVEEVYLEPPKKQKKKKEISENSDNEDKNNNLNDEEKKELEENEENEDKNEEENENENDDPDFKKPYNPYGKSWSDYNGQPRNYLQILKKFTGNSINEYNIQNSNKKDKVENIIQKLNYLINRSFNLKVIEQKEEEFYKSLDNEKYVEFKEENNNNENTKKVKNDSSNTNVYNPCEINLISLS